MLRQIVHTATLGVILLAIAHVPANAQDQPKPVEKQTTGHNAEEANADHKAAAQRFEKEATEFDKEAAEHEQMAVEYRQRARALPKSNYATLADHCDRLAKNLKAAAAEARETAKLHEDIAKQTTK